MERIGTILGRTMALLSAAAMLGGAMFVATACDNANGEEGTAAIALTDAPADEIAIFEVDVTDVTLTRPNGNTHSALPEEVRVDFAELRSFDDLVAAADLKVGAYNEASMTLDFADAEIVLVGESTPATIVDGNGDPLTGTVTVNIGTAPHRRIVIKPDRMSLIRLDLNLNASASVDRGANEVTVHPVVTLEVDPADEREVRVTGELDSVDTMNSTFTAEKKGLNGTVLVTRTFDTDAQTIFQIDGDVYVGSAGLTELSMKAAGTPVVVTGTFNASAGQFEVTHVAAGTGTIGASQDIAIGIVTARSGGAGSDATLTVATSAVIPDGSLPSFNETITVNASFADTPVIMRDATSAMDLDAINVGQAVVIYGDYDAGTSTMDATATADGVIRAQLTAFRGIATGPAVNGTLTIDLKRINLRAVDGATFTFAGSGIDPAAFTVQLNGLDASGIEAGTPVRVRGMIRGLDAINGDDASAHELYDRSSVADGIGIRWIGGGVADPVDSINGARIDLSIQSTWFALVSESFASASPLAGGPTLQAANPQAGEQLYVIVNDGDIEMFVSFGRFSAALRKAEQDGATPMSVWAVGEWNDSTSTLDTRYGFVVMRD